MRQAKVNPANRPVDAAARHLTASGRRCSARRRTVSGLAFTQLAPSKTSTHRRVVASQVLGDLTERITVGAVRDSDRVHRAREDLAQRRPQRLPMCSRNLGNGLVKRLP